MKNPFKILFVKELSDLNKDQLIDLFLINLKGTLYEKVEIENNNRIIIKGEFFSFDPLKNVPWNLWTGFSRKAELYFPSDNIIAYSVDFKYGIISMIIGLIFSLLIPILFSFRSGIFYFVFLAVVLFVMLGSIIIKLLLHRHLFYKTTRFENRYKGNYDWTEILKNKSSNDLNAISSGNTTFTMEVQKMAKEEIERRKTGYNKG